MFVKLWVIIIIQDGTTKGKNCKGGGDSEDCLNLNIYLPEAALAPGAALFPVMVNIHGGAFVGGSNDQGSLQGEYLAQEQNIIVVQMNYRLGAFGFWYFDEPDSNGYQTNWALLDQRLAMEWVRINIRGFGGDPDRVTLSGCSAGGQSAIIHAVSQQSWPYFQQMASFSAPLGLRHFII